MGAPLLSTDSQAAVTSFLPSNLYTYGIETESIHALKPRATVVNTQRTESVGPGSSNKGIGIRLYLL